MTPIKRRNGKKSPIVFSLVKLPVIIIGPTMSEDHDIVIMPGNFTCEK